MVKKANRSEWLAQKRVEDAQKRLRPTVDKLPPVLTPKQVKEKKAVGLRAARRKRCLKASNARKTAQKKREQKELEHRERELESYRWSTPCSSPELPVSHTWRLLDQVTYPREIWYGGIVLVSARCAACGARAKFSEGAWEATEALGDGPCGEWS